MDGRSDEPSLGSRPLVSASTTNELLLTRRLAQVEKERDDLAAELSQLRGDSSRASRPDTAHGLVIPPEMLPTLSILRSHITTLTRDSDALRYTFLGRTSAANPSDHMGDAGKPRVAGVNLEDVLVRVEALVRENEELGEMVLHAGQADVAGLEQALDDSRAVIRSLDADLDHHLATINDLRAQLERYQSRYGPLPGDKDITPVSMGQTSQDKSRRSSTSSRGVKPAPANAGGGSVRRGTAGGRPDPTREGGPKVLGDGPGGSDARRDGDARGRGRPGGRRASRASHAGRSHAP